MAAGLLTAAVAVAVVVTAAAANASAPDEAAASFPISGVVTGSADPAAVEVSAWSPPDPGAGPAGWTEVAYVNPDAAGEYVLTVPAGPDGAGTDQGYIVRFADPAIPGASNAQYFPGVDWSGPIGTVVGAVRLTGAAADVDGTVDPTVTISGTVTDPSGFWDAGTVTLTQGAGRGAVAQTTTDAAGAFAFAAYPGSYLIGAQDTDGGYDGEYYPHQFAEFAGDRTLVPTAVGAGGLDGADIDLQFADNHTIQGSVHDQDGNPLGDVEVFVHDMENPSTIVFQTSTDSEGGWHTQGIPDGRYLVGFNEGADPDLPTVFYRDVLTADVTDPAITPVDIYQQDASDIDASLSLSALHTIVGTVSTPSGVDPSTVVVTAWRNTDDGWVVAGQANPIVDGPYELDVPSGEYRVEFSDPSGSLLDQVYPGITVDPDVDIDTVVGASSVFVADGDVSAIDAELAAAPNITLGTPTITGTAAVGTTLTAEPGPVDPADATLAYQWLRDGAAIAAATATTYPLTAADLGAEITVTVTASRQFYLPTGATSAPTAAVGEGTLNPAPTPAITGTPGIGHTLTAVPGTWGPGSPTLSYQWLAGGTPIAGATATTFTVTAAQLDATITVSVTGSEPGFAAVTRTSTPTAAIPPLTLGLTPTPTIVGNPTVGLTLTGHPGVWTPTPVTLHLQWKAGGVAIAGATASTYQLRPADAGKRITLTVVGSRTYYATVSTTSAPTTPVALGTLSGSVPTVIGTPRLGTVLSINLGLWTPGTGIALQWKAGSVAIAGATRTTLSLTAALVGKPITVAATGTAPGYHPLTLTSRPTAAVAPGSLTESRPAIRGTAQVGATLVATTGSWLASPAATAITLHYQWTANGAAIAGATAAKYLVTAGQLGKRLTVTITGAAPGYTSASATSTPTALVTKGVIHATVPTITGTPTIGQRLTAHALGWSPAQLTLSYQWKSDGSAIPGATHSTWVIQGTSNGTNKPDRITVTVTGTAAGYAPASMTSAPTPPVTAPRA